MGLQLICDSDKSVDPPAIAGGTDCLGSKQAIRRREAFVTSSPHTRLFSDSLHFILRRTREQSKHNYGYCERSQTDTCQRGLESVIKSALPLALACRSRFQHRHVDAQRGR